MSMTPTWPSWSRARSATTRLSPRKRAAVSRSRPSSTTPGRSSPGPALELEKNLRALVERDIGGKQQRITRMDTRHVGVSLKLLLLPAYEGTYRYGGKAYKVLINGDSGDVSGDYPVSAGKVTFLILLILGALGLIGAAVWFFLIRPNIQQRSEVPPPVGQTFLSAAPGRQECLPHVSQTYPLKVLT